MRVFTRRRLLALGGLVGAGYVGVRLGLPALLRRPAPRALEGEAADFVARLFEGLDRARMWDAHAHVFGVGDGGTGCRVHRSVRDRLRPYESTRFDVFLAVAGVDADAPDLDGQYLRRLLELHRLANPRGRLVLLALDEYVDAEGRARPDLTQFHTPDEYVLRLAERESDVEAGASIHPYRDDAVERLDAAVERGARLVKWIPAAQGIDPASPRCDAFYRRLASRGIPLLTHAGQERAVSAPGGQELGNPLRLRRPLEAGVQVIVAHCASDGEDEDLDAPAGKRGRSPAFALLQRMFGEARHERTLFGGISAITQVNRSGGPLRELLLAGELHHRLVNGSDYPLPAVDPLFSTRWLEHQGYLTSEERRLCNVVFEANPLLFDFCVKRCLKVVERGYEHRFAPTVFETEWLLG